MLSAVCMQLPGAPYPHMWLLLTLSDILKLAVAIMEILLSLRLGLGWAGYRLYSE